MISVQIKDMLKKLYDDNIDALYRYAYFKLSDEQEAMDIIQEAFYKISLELEKGKQIENLKSYLYRCVSNLIIDHYRKNKPVSLEESLETIGDTLKSDENIENITHAKLEVEKIYAILKGLDDFDKDIFLLRYVQEMTPAEIAQIYEEDVNAVTVRLHRIKEKVVSQLGPNTDDHE